MMLSNVKRLLVAALAPFAIACVEPYHARKLAAPNPFTRPGCKLVVESINYDRLMVGEEPLPQYMSEKKAESQDSLQKDLEASSGRFYARITSENSVLTQPKRAAVPDNTFMLRSYMTKWEPGFYAVVASQPAEMNIVVDVVDSGGNVVDEIVVNGAGGAGFASGDRMRELADMMGSNVNRYIEKRWLCAPR